MSFNEDAFRAEATSRGFTPEQVDAYIASKAQKPSAPAQAQVAVSTQEDTFDEVAFRSKATAQGFTPEQQEAYLAAKTMSINTDPATFATPSLDLPFAVKPFYREHQPFNTTGKYQNPMTLRSKGYAIPGVSPTDAEYEARIRNTLDADTVIRIAKQIKVDPSTQDGINAVYSHAEREHSWRQDKQALLANLQELTSVERPFKWMKSTFNTAADAEWRSIKAQNLENIAALAKERGLDLVHQDGEFFAHDNQGNLHRITPDFLDSIGKAKHEVLGGLAGAIAGARAPVNSPYAKLAAIAVGGITGSVLGEEVDYLASAIEAHESLDARVAAEKALGTAQMSALFEIAGLGTAKLSTAAWKQVKRAYNFVSDGNTAGAYMALKDSLGYLDDTQVEELVARWEKLNQSSAPGKTAKEKAIAVLPTTAPGGEIIASAAARLDPRAAVTIRADLNARAQSVLQLAKNPADDTGAQLRSALAAYTTEVKTAFDIVKRASADIVPERYEFNLTTKSLLPMLETTIDEIADPAVVEKLTRLLVKVDQTTAGRTFNDLLDLRELLNEFKYANKVTSKSTFVAGKGIDEARAEVDSEIRRVMEQTAEGKQWLDDWRSVNKAYGEYKMVQKNALYRAVTKPGATPKSIAQALVKHGPALDDTYADVVAKLPVQTKALVENEIIDSLANKAALGNLDGFRAISFPDLAEELRVYNFTSAKAMQLKQAVNSLAEVYRNDKALFNVKPGLATAEGQTIATTITGKMRMAFVNNLWRKIKQVKGGAQADISALVDKSAQFLENPLDSKVVEKVLADVKDDAELSAAVKRLQQEAAREKAEGTGAAQLRVFRDKSGRLFYQNGSSRLPTESIPAHRVVQGKRLSEVLGRDITSSSYRTLTKAERALLAKKGFMAVALENGQLITIGQ